MVTNPCSNNDGTDRHTEPPRTLPVNGSYVLELLRGHLRASLPHHGSLPPWVSPTIPHKRATKKAAMEVVHSLTLPPQTHRTQERHLSEQQTLTLQFTDLCKDRPCLWQVRSDGSRNTVETKKYSLRGTLCEKCKS